MPLHSKHTRRRRFFREAWTAPLLLIAGFWWQDISAPASNLDVIGVTLLQAVTTNLDGRGIRVGQVEGAAPAWEVTPANVGLPESGFTWYENGQQTNTFPNALGTDSPHADIVGSILYGLPDGAITNVPHIDNYEASYFSQFTLPVLLPLDDSVFNLSFTINGITLTELEGYDLSYDGYAANYNTLFIGAVGDSGPVGTPGACYNGIGVGAHGGASSVGPTPDNGRAKPDVTAPGTATSYSAPLVSACAVMLLEAGLRGDGGSDTNSASDPRVIKALLLNGAIKPSDWANPSPSPLDPRYGAGIIHVFNSYSQLVAGKHGFIANSAVSLGGAHPPEGTAGNVASLNGWDFDTLSSSATNDSINHYYFNLGNGVSNATFTGTATLVWNRQLRQTNINNLDLFLYQAGSGNLIASSVSTVDNLEHIFVAALPSGRYDLQVLKHGGASVSTNENYALAFEFFNLSLNLVCAGTNVMLNWPIYPAGFRLEANSSLTAPSNWTAVNLTPVVTNNQNLVILTPGSGGEFFRLIRP